MLGQNSKEVNLRDCRSLPHPISARAATSDVHNTRVEGTLFIALNLRGAPYTACLGRERLKLVPL